MTMLFGKEHVKKYIETDGRVGHDWQRGAPVLLLTTIGRASGEPRTTPLIYQKHGAAYLVVPSNGGAAKPPHWYLNLVDNPDVRVQVWGDRFAARARSADPAEAPELWQKMTSVWPAYDGYQRKTKRVIPVVVLDPVAGAT